MAQPVSDQKRSRLALARLQRSMWDWAAPMIVSPRVYEELRRELNIQPARVLDSEGAHCAEG